MKPRPPPRLWSIFVAIVVLPIFAIILVAAAPFVWLFGRAKKRSADEGVQFLKRAGDNSLAERDWETFTKTKIRDERLDIIRQKAVICGPPHADQLLIKEASLIGRHKLHGTTRKRAVRHSHIPAISAHLEFGHAAEDVPVHLAHAE
jgi:hypothetical protein